MSTPPLDDLLRHERALRAIVRPIVGIADTDDVLQQTWMRCLRAQPGQAPLRAWLGAIARNAALAFRRSEVRRRRRETVVAAMVETSSDPADSRLAELRRMLADAMQCVQEPHRTTLVLHFFEGMALVDIAARCGERPGTIRMRLQRGLAALRSELERRHGRDWRQRLLIVPGFTALHGNAGGGRGGGAATAAVGGVARVGWQHVAVATAVLFLAAMWWRTLPVGPAPTSVAVAAMPELAVLDAGRGADPTNGPELSREPGLPLTAVATTPTPDVVIGRVLDVAGLPLAAVEIGWRDEGGPGVARRRDVAFHTHTDADGCFTLARCPVGRLQLGGEFVCLGETSAHQRDIGGELLLIAARRRALQLVVQRADGQPISGAEARFEHRFLHRLPVPAHNLRRLVPTAATASDASGWLAFVDFPDQPDGELVVEARGHRPLRLAAAELWRRAGALVPVVMHEVATTEPGERRDGAEWTSGFVVDERGEVVAGARVAAAGQLVKTDANGRFWLHRVPASSSLLAAHPLHGSGEATLPRERAAMLRVELRANTARLRGRVRDRRGRAVAGALVQVLDPTWLRSPASLDEALELAAENTPHAGLRVPFAALTAADGSFELGGLRPRAYRLRVVDPQRAAVRAVATSVAGAGHANEVVAELWLDDAATATGSLRVVDAAKRPIANVDVSVLFRPFPELPALRAPLLRTRLDARATLAVPSHPAHELDAMLALTHPDYLPQALRGGVAEGRVDQIELSRVQVLELRPDALAAVPAAEGLASAALQAHAADGERLLVGAHDGVGFFYAWRLPYVPGQVPLVHACERAVELRLVLGDRELARLPIGDGTGIVRRVR